MGGGERGGKREGGEEGKKRKEGEERGRRKGRREREKRRREFSPDLAFSDRVQEGYLPPMQWTHR